MRGILLVQETCEGASRGVSGSLHRLRHPTDVAWLHFWEQTTIYLCRQLYRLSFVDLLPDPRIDRLKSSAMHRQRHQAACRSAAEATRVQASRRRRGLY